MKESIKSANLYPDDKKTFLISIITTKDYKAVLKILLSNFSNCHFIFTDGTDEIKFFKGNFLYDYAKSLNTSNTLEYTTFEHGLLKLNSKSSCASTDTKFKF